MASFGVLYVCNDNLVEKFRTGAPLNGLEHVEDKSKIFSEYFYGSATPIGYTDLSVYAPKEDGPQ